MAALADSPGESFPQDATESDFKHPANSLMERTRCPTILSPWTSQTIRCPTLKGSSLRTSSGMVICHLDVIVDTILLILMQHTIFSYPYASLASFPMVNCCVIKKPV